MQTNEYVKLGVALILAAANMAAANAAPASTGADNWTKLFADEAWYGSQAGDEQVFRGKLVTVEPPEASTLMRDSLYTLGKWTIYTGAKKIQALEALAGKEIEIRGKAVEMNLEGRQLNEIWPAAVRPAAATANTAQDAASATALARDHLARSGVKAEQLQAFPLPAPADGWWMVEYVVPGAPRHGTGPYVFVNRATGDVTKQAPKGTPPLM